MSNRKVGIIGAGAVGATAAYTLGMMGTCNEIVLYDIAQDVAIGKAIDIEQSTIYSQCIFGLTTPEFSKQPSNDMVINGNLPLHESVFGRVFSLSTLMIESILMPTHTLTHTHIHTYTHIHTHTDHRLPNFIGNYIHTWCKNNIATLGLSKYN